MRWRVSSCMNRAAVTERFSDGIMPRIGIAMRRSASIIAVSLSPVCSLPNSSATSGGSIVASNSDSADASTADAMIV